MHKIYPIMIVLLFAGCRGTRLMVEPVENVNLERYAGKWYEIAHLPVSFQKNCSCTTAEYGLTDKGYVRVVNRCKKTTTGDWDEATGKAFPVKNSNNAKLKVQFFWPFRGDYWILRLDEDYQYAVVGGPSPKYLWILSRTPEMEESLYNRLVGEMKELGFPVEELIRTEQGCWGEES